MRTSAIDSRELVKDTFWSGLDHELCAEIRSLGKGASFTRVKAHMLDVDKREMTYGPPLVIRSSFGKHIKLVCAAYHRLIEAIMRLYVEREDIREVLTVPESLQRFALGELHPMEFSITYCRPDLHPVPGGHFYILETNADCPGGPLSAGVHAGLWRKELTEVALPPPMEIEDPAWFADWLTWNGKQWVGEFSETIALLRTGYRYELDEMRKSLTLRGVNVIEADPREMVLDTEGRPSLQGVPVSFGYQKFDIPDCCNMYDDLDVFFDAITQRKFFVHNGMLAKLVGDNKLCLAVLTDPTFRDLFDASDMELVEPHLIWTRNIALCSPQEIKDIRANKDAYVIKKPIEAQGKGVVIGRDVQTNIEWDQIVTSAIDTRWLVTEYRQPAEMYSRFHSDDIHHHDICPFLINGHVVGADARTSTNRRANIALGGAIHAVFFQA